MVLVLASLVLIFVGGTFAEDMLAFIGLGPTVAAVWSVVRWPAAVLVAMSIFALTYYATPDVHHRSFRWITPGAVVGVLLWPAASFGFSLYVSRITDIGALYGALAGPIVLVIWLLLTSAALLFGAEFDAEIERRKGDARRRPTGGDAESAGQARLTPLAATAGAQFAGQPPTVACLPSRVSRASPVRSNTWSDLIG